MDPRQAFGAYLRQHRLARALSQERLAARCRTLRPDVTGIYSAVISWWEIGDSHRSTPREPQVDALADALGMSDEERAEAHRLATAGRARRPYRQRRTALGARPS